VTVTLNTDKYTSLPRGCHIVSHDQLEWLMKIGGVAYTWWDANGNLVSGGGYTYTYDSANWLVNFQEGRR